MKIVIADDESLARQQLKRLIEEIGSPYQVVAEATTGTEAVAACTKYQADLALLDIRMPELDGLQAAAQLVQGEWPPAVLFVTAYDEYALQAFERSAVDYLLKPIRRERLEQALAKFSVLTRPQLQALEELQSEPQSEEVISVSYRGGLQRIPLNDVIYLQAQHKYVVACHLQGEVLLEDSLKTLESRYPQRFLRIHRNALVAKQRLRGLVKLGDGRCLVDLNDTDEQLEISRRHLPEVRRWLKS